MSSDVHPTYRRDTAVLLLRYATFTYAAGQYDPTRRLTERAGELLQRSPRPNRADSK